MRPLTSHALQDYNTSLLRRSDLDFVVNYERLTPPKSKTRKEMMPREYVNRSFGNILYYRYNNRERNYRSA